MSKKNYLQMAKDFFTKPTPGSIATFSFLSIMGFLYLHDKAEYRKVRDYINSLNVHTTNTRVFQDGQVFNPQSGSTIHYGDNDYPINMATAVINGELANGAPEGIDETRLRMVLKDIIVEMNGLESIDKIPGGGRGLVFPDINENGHLDINQRSMDLGVNVRDYLEGLREERRILVDKHEKEIERQRREMNNISNKYLEEMRKNKDMMKKLE